MDKLLMNDGLKQLFKINALTIDNTVFRLHYKLTALLLFAASIMVTGTQLWGNPIKCIVAEKFPAKVVETYCWIESTFTLPKYLHRKVGEEIVYPGVGKHVEGDESVRHAYYQWVCFVLFLQACLFVVPHFLWKSWEGQKIKNLILGLDKPVVGYETRQTKYKDLVGYFVFPGHGHQEYFFKFLLCEILNFVNVVGQIFLVDKFLGGEFSTYGSQVFQFMLSDQEERYDPMIRVFPRMTKCTFHHYGPSGDVQKLDTYCVLPLNILNEKIYVMVWFWFVLLAIVSGLALIYRVAMVVWPRGRYLMIKSTNHLSNTDNLDYIVRYLSYGDWFVLYNLGNNMDCVNFKEMVDALAKKLSSHEFRGEESFEKEGEQLNL